MPLPESLPQNYSQTDDCAICFEKLIIPNHQDGETPSTVIDDVQLFCGPKRTAGHHFHWTCLQEFDDEGWDRTTCPTCKGDPLDDEGRLIANIMNEGGFTGGIDLGDLFDEAKEDSQKPIEWKKGQALLSALQFMELEDAERLLAEGTSADSFYEAGHLTALHMAALNNDVKGAELLLRFGADVDVKTQDGKTARELAESEKATDFIELLDKHAQRPGAAQ